jgi:hypothetical protein
MKNQQLGVNIVDAEGKLGTLNLKGLGAGN